MWEPPECPGPCFDLHFDRFDGFIFEAEKPFENVCAMLRRMTLKKKGATKLKRRLQRLLKQPRKWQKPLGLGILLIRDSCL